MSDTLTVTIILSIIIIIVGAMIGSNIGNHHYTFNSKCDNTSPINRQMYFVPLQSSIDLSKFLFIEESTQKTFACNLSKAIYYCMMIETKKFCQNQEQQKIILEFFENTSITVGKMFEMEFDHLLVLNKLCTNVSPLDKLTPADVLMPVFKAYQDSSKYNKDEYYKIVLDYLHQEYPRFSELNLKFRGYIRNIMNNS